ncbi:hypothetical protein ATKI12_2304 [Kitasatospora sp. Ki12]
MGLSGESGQRTGQNGEMLTKISVLSCPRPRRGDESEAAR